MNKEQLYEEDNKISYVFFFNLLNCIVFYPFRNIFKTYETPDFFSLLN